MSMTREEFVKAIRFSKETYDNRLLIKAQVTFGAYQYIDKFELLAVGDLERYMSSIHSELTENLLRHLYDYKQDELNRAIHELHCVNPVDYGRMHEAIEQVRLAALKKI